jgi:hypothetical protein
MSSVGGSSRNYEIGSGIITGDLVTITSFSGGVALPAFGSILSVTVENLSGNGNMWIGGTGNATSYPVSGHGLVFYPGAVANIRVDNSSDVRIFAENSGNQVSWMVVKK